MPKMILVRGLPGSGKSTLALKILDEYPHNNVRWWETDIFFTRNNVYSYDRDKISVAHKWCQKMVEQDMLQGHDILVSNTFTTYAEMIPYFILARDFGYRVEIITCKGEYPNIHNVPEDVIQRMRERWED